MSHKTSIEQMHQNLTAMFLEHTSTNLVKISQLDEKSFFLNLRDNNNCLSPIGVLGENNFSDLGFPAKFPGFWFLKV